MSRGYSFRYCEGIASSEAVKGYTVAVYLPYTPVPELFFA